MGEIKIYIILSDTGTLFTRLIKLYTKKTYNHASISFDADLSKVYSFGRKSARNPFAGGFVKEDVQKGLFEHADCIIYSVTVGDFEVQKMKHYINRIEAQKQYYRYNLLGLFGVAINRAIDRKNAFFCSQFVASVLNECDSITFEKSISLIAPNDFQNIASFQLEYEGKLMGYSAEGIVENRIPVYVSPMEA